MSGKNGRSATIIAWVEKNPGKTGKQIGKALGHDHTNGLLTYMVKHGLVFASGPRHWHRYYATEALAKANHERICAEAQATREHKEAVARRAANLRRRGRSHAQGKPVHNVVISKALNFTPLGKGVKLHPEVKITVAVPMKDRFAPEPGFERVITGDYMLLRQGATA